MFDLAGKTALVTGAGQNVGAGIARSLAGCGAAVVVNDVVPDRAEAVVAEISADGAQASVSVFDVTDRQAVVEAVQAADPVDVLVNNAGNAGVGAMVVTPFRELDPAEWGGPIDVNLFGVLNTAHAVVGPMIDRGWGRIVTIVSGAGTSGVGIGVTPYSAAKAGAAGFMRSLALETAGSGVTANSVSLGLMENVAGGEHVERLERRVPARRLGSPADVGALCVYLASEESSWMTGQTLGLNGGAVTS